MSEGARSRPGIIILGIIIVVGGAAGILWLRQTPGVLPVNKLIEQLKSDKPTEQVTAAEGLAKLGDPAALDPLIAVLTDKEWTVRRAAGQALGELHDGRAVDPLITRLKDDNAWVVIAAAQALGKIGDKSAVKPLEKRLKAEKKKKKDKRNTDVLTYTQNAIDKLKNR